MKNKDWKVIVAACAVAMAGAWGPASASAADSGEAKDKPALYTYEASWAIPRAKWADYEKSGAGTSKVLDQAISSGAIVAYGNDSDLIHTADGSTHDDWWSALSEAGVLNTLDAIYKAGGGTSPALTSATKHWDNLFVSHHYGWHPGSWKGAYTHWSTYNLKPDAPNDAVSTIAKVFVEPLMEKLLADGTIVEYEIDEEAIHTENPDLFAISYITTTAEGLDKAQAALRDAAKKTPLIGPAMDGMVDFTKHRDGLTRTTATYK
jgi:hypothetical protein